MKLVTEKRILATKTIGLLGIVCLGVGLLGLVYIGINTIPLREIKFSTISQGRDLGSKKEKIIITNSTQWSDFCSKYNLNQIYTRYNFTRTTVMAILMGRCPVLGYSITVTSIAVSFTSINVYITEVHPNAYYNFIQTYS